MNFTLSSEIWDDLPSEAVEQPVSVSGQGKRPDSMSANRGGSRGRQTSGGTGAFQVAKPVPCRGRQVQTRPSYSILRNTEYVVLYFFKFFILHQCAGRSSSINRPTRILACKGDNYHALKLRLDLALNQQSNLHPTLGTEFLHHCNHL
jgi:hypothetical protein